VSVTNPLGQVTAYGYNKAGYLTSLTDPAGNVTTWERDIQNRVTAKVYANGTKETYTYDPATGQLATVTDALGQVKTFTYTIDERVSQIAYTNTAVDTPNVSFAYGKDYPRVESRTDGIGTTLYAYAPVGTFGAGQVGQETTPHGIIDWEYDALGRKINRRVGDVAESTEYDQIGRILSITNPLGSFQYEYAGQSDLPTALLSIGGVLDTYFRYGPFNESRRLRAIHHNALFPLQVMDFLYQSNPEDQVVQATDIGGQLFPQFKSYQYDAAGRLTGENAFPGGMTRYQYDPADNITAVQSPEDSWTASYNDVNEIVERQDRSYTYDANGNLTGDGIRTYTWDAENRLVAIGYLDQPEKRSQFQYDGLNRRAVMTETNGTASQTTTFLWDGTDLLRGQTGTEATWYYAQGEIHGNRKLYYVQDRLGSVRETVGEDRIVTSRMSYTPYGVTETRLPPFIGKAPDYRYAGLFFHEASGLYLAVFRVYDPGAGRWINKNPVDLLEGNLFKYVSDSPVNYIDKRGLFVDVGSLIGLGAAIGGATETGIEAAHCGGHGINALNVAEAIGFGALAVFIGPETIAGAVLVGAGIGAAEYITSRLISGKPITLFGVAENTFFGGLGGGIAGPIVKPELLWDETSPFIDKTLAKMLNNDAYREANLTKMGLFRASAGAIVGSGAGAIKDYQAATSGCKCS
jgi:RHS repeat-associated protein